MVNVMEEIKMINGKMDNITDEMKALTQVVEEQVGNRGQSRRIDKMKVDIAHFGLIMNRSFVQSVLERCVLG